MSVTALQKSTEVIEKGFQGNSELVLSTHFIAYLS